jgi:hypothetical protein
MGQKNVGPEPNELGRVFRQARVVALGPPEIDQDILSLDIAEVAQTEPELGECLLEARRRGCAEKAEACDLRRWLGPCAERHRGRRAAEQRDDLASPDAKCHLIPPAGRATEG